MPIKTELLAPAGSFESLKAAVESGADAVYLGAKSFNARMKSENFSENDFERAVDYAHSKDVFVYLTLNTLVQNNEIALALETARQAADFGVDAFIVQDVGLFGLLKHNFPDVGIHASTQMTVCDKAGAEFAFDLGAKRIVLARELSLDEIAEILGAFPTREFETFIHGALCICYSGQCQMSNSLGGRSGNRGNCAQPCRLPYLLTVNGKQVSRNHLLSPKDLCGLDAIPQLVGLGVRSLKIEGRLKSPEYVAATTSIYRKYLDMAEDPSYSVMTEDLDILAQVFNRGGFTKGWFYEDARPTIMSVEKPKNWGLQIGETTSRSDSSRTAKVRLSAPVEIGDGIEIWTDAETSPGGVVSVLMKDGRHIKTSSPGEVVTLGNFPGSWGFGCKVYKTSSKSLCDGLLREVNLMPRKVKISAEIEIAFGKPVVLKVSDAFGNLISKESDVGVEASQKVNLTEERISEQLSKTSGTPFVIENSRVRLELGAYFPLSEISRLRRDALDELNMVRISKYKRSLQVKDFILPSIPTSFSTVNLELGRQISVLFFDEPNVQVLQNSKVDVFYLPINTHWADLPKTLNFSRVFAWLPAGVKSGARVLVDAFIETAVNAGVSGLLLGGIGDLKYTKIYPTLRFRTNYGFNVANNFAAECFAPIPTTVSLDLEPEQIAGMCGDDMEVLAYGTPMVMSTTQFFRHGGTMESPRGRRFEILKSPSEYGSIILSSQIHSIVADCVHLTNIRSFRIESLNLSENELNNAINRLDKVRRNENG